LIVTKIIEVIATRKGRGGEGRGKEETEWEGRGME